MTTPIHLRPLIGRRALLVVVAAALAVLTPRPGLATDDGGATDDGSGNEIVDESDLDDGDELVEWGDDVEVWSERADGTKLIPEVLPELDYYSKAMSVSVEEANGVSRFRTRPECFNGSLLRSWATAS